MKLLFKIIIFNFLYGFTPNNFSVIDINNSETRDYRDTENNLADDTIVDLRDGYNNNAIYVGTSGGISGIDISSTSFSHFVDENLPDGGNPATITYELANGETMIVVSGVLSYYSSAENANIPYGTGIAWSLDSGENWLYTDQPTDELPECEELGCEDPLDSPNNCECSPGSSGCTWNVPSETCSYMGSYIPFDWYGQTAYLNPITVDEKNVTYDISVDLDKKYIYIASWAGMLRRLKYTDFQPTWELVPLPEDISQTGDEDQLLCGGIGQSYVYNPVDISGNNNHKVFSVHVEEDEIWAGTANGVNKGIIGEDNCIDWTHYSSNNSSLTRDWVIDIVPQDLSNGGTRIWLIAREVVSPPAPHGITYTDNGGEDWVSIGNLFNEEDALIYNLYFSDSHAYASTDRGLFSCDTEIDMEIWEELDIPANCFDDTEAVYSYIKNNDINFVGTPNGLIFNLDICPAHVDECGNGWCNNNYTNQNFSKLAIYPNPVSSFTNFMFKTDFDNGSVDIFDFSMNIVSKNIDCDQFLEDDGNYYLKCNYDNIKLSNGVYFCRLSYGENEVWNKLMIINN